ncbi:MULTISPECIES: carbohydrate ABC transporter permease [Bacillales]|jgi:raffinose/stachyose/melibiose transport system permease protein|uniref:Sugar ABC transporter permease n=1 Tax=Brevibacillus aydinogluensis TaxID=927786 RepID=A0AA48RFZ4_9BACL|nr:MULTISPECIES: carbohydrate ABC transporter permease [Bacillales]REK60960.1 MAG: carbohydrate ABC transporter permease [Brevibacillus sp.]MBR8661491.1 carbohydrate ABC transporter permease [Brevibacillus sp. NL20B1]MDT3417844.1 raffinose/stachyose/melibiose transport system permease protein [Brevibacillus aydinogluensis]NNV03290.1 carbohydrate ABC transporter permease [Brevibacillus sp. MCWH]UFJ62607.1 carbohydrate ABC transporter permease [Anoxybacillus sediminis]
MTARLGQFAKYLVLLVFSVLMLYPVFLMIASSFKSNLEILTSPLGLPASLSLENYKLVWEKVNFGAYVWNSVYVSGLSVLLILFLSSLAAFYLSRYPFRWNPYVLFFFMLGLMLPMKLAILPLYMIMLQLKLLDTLTSLVILYVAGGIPFAVFVFYGFFKTLPTELDQSARLDGCNGFQVYWKIILPLMKPPLATVGIVHLIGVWNDFFYPLIFLKSEELSTIPLGVLTLFGEYDTEWNLLFASLTISSLPMIVAFLFASKQFIEGLTSGAIK